jgi:cytochrome c553
MKYVLLFSTIILFIIGFSQCTPELYLTNGETIFRTGKNLAGEKLQNIAASKMKMLHGCDNCHGNNGKGKSNHKTGSISFNDLSNSALHHIPYTDKLLIRFLDHELKSDSTIANTGVIWKMSDADKRDLIAFLKTL